ncbi:MAG: hypothetical protein AAFO94_05475, partial [Bacteroidota bacterium]
GKPLALEVMFGGRPSPTAEWSKNGEAITDARVVVFNSEQSLFETERFWSSCWLIFVYKLLSFMNFLLVEPVHCIDIGHNPKTKISHTQSFLYLHKKNHGRI